MRQQSGGRRPRNRPNRKQQVSPRIHNFDSQGPEGRVRGNAPQVYEKYMSLARDATSSGDRIVAESYYQFAEHYYRIMNETTDPERPGLDPARQAREQPRVPCEPEHGWGNGRGTEQPRPAQAEVDGTPMRASVPRPLDSARPLEPAGPRSSASLGGRLKVGNGAARRTAKGQEPEPSDPADGEAGTWVGRQAAGGSRRGHDRAPGDGPAFGRAANGRASNARVPNARVFSGRVPSGRGRS